MVVNWGNTGLEYARGRQMTRNDLRIRRRCCWHQQPQPRRPWRPTCRSRSQPGRPGRPDWPNRPGMPVRPPGVCTGVPGSAGPGEGSIPAYRDCGLHAAVSLNREDQSSSPIEVASAWPFRAIPTEDLGCGGLKCPRLMKAMRARLRRGSRRLWPGGAGLVR
jgi:hypothetical protein